MQFKRTFLLRPAFQCNTAASGDDAGFTLVELIIAVAIIGVLSAISMTGYMIYADKAEFAKADITLHHVKTILEANSDSLAEAGTDFLWGQSGAHGEPLAGALQQLLPEMVVPDRVQIAAMRSDCFFQGRSMEFVRVFSCKPGYAQWYMRSCMGFEVTSPRFYIGKGIC